MSAGEHGGLAILKRFPLTPWPAVVRACAIASDDGEDACEFWREAQAAAERWEAKSRNHHGGLQ